jgi:sirohydrochlorin cobaltochelatase
MTSLPTRDRLSHEAGLLLVGHGTRYAPGVDEFFSLSRAMADSVGVSAVEPCFLEFAQPSIAAGFARLVERGARHIVVAPVILFAAGHIRCDIPREVAAAAATHPGVSFQQAPHLGCHPALAQLSSQRYLECIGPAPAIAPEDTLLVLVGRGSRDAEATREMLQFAQMRREAGRAREIHTAFLAMADPPLEPTLARLALMSPQRIVVQPHLLFAGELLERVGSMVERLAQTYSDVDWRVTDHLGPSPLIASAILDRASEAAVVPIEPD